MKRFLLLALCALFACQAEARTLYVNAKRPNNNGNARSASTAKKTIQAAINIAKKGDVILVAPGTYAPIKTNNKKISIKSVKGQSKTKIVKTTQYDNIPLAQLGKTYTYETSSPGNYSTMIKISSAPLTKGSSTTLTGFLLDGNGKYGLGLIGVSGGTVSSCTIRKICGGGNWGTQGMSKDPAPSIGTMVAYNSKLTACTIKDNSWSDWGMLSSCTLNRCKVAGNSIDLAGTGYSDSGWHLVSNCRLYNCLLSKNTTKSGFCGMVTYSTLVNCTAADNLVLAAKDESGTWLGTAGPFFSSSSKWYNCVLRNNKARVDVVSGGWVDDYDENGEWAGDHWVEQTTTTGVPVVHNFDAYSGNVYKNTDTTNKNPKFVNAAKGNYKLKKGSYCIDKGKLTKKQKKQVGKTDLAGKARIRGKAVDRGCYEY